MSKLTSKKQMGALSLFGHQFIKPIVEKLANRQIAIAFVAVVPEHFHKRALFLVL